MSAPNETPLEDLKNALQMLYGARPRDNRSEQLLGDARRRILSAVRKLELEPPPASDPSQPELGLRT